MANPEHLAILKQGVEVWNAWRLTTDNINPDLSNANLTNAEGEPTPGAPNSRHQYGDAADIRVVPSGSQTVWMDLWDELQLANPGFSEPANGPCGYKCVHGDWRGFPGDYRP